MKQIFKTTILVSLALLMFSCQKDPMSEILDGKWNKERNVLAITLENQIGPSTIIRDEFEQTITAFVDQTGLNFVAVKVESIVLSYDASANVETGGVLNFNNAEYKSEITVTSKAGEPLVWTIIIEPYDLFYIGKYAYAKQEISIKQEYGSEWAEEISTKFPKAIPEVDNSIEIVYEGYENGRTYGSLINNAGPDGAYGVFANDGVDISSKIRHLIPEGTSKWEMDLNSNTMYIIKDGKSAEAKVTKTEGGMHLMYVLKYKPEEPYWDYGAHDNYLSWSYQYDIELVKNN
ncbi:MAG TPA: hypothetical protein VJY41_07150 [Prolixibacteraceae bacterium]|nr:hypothetical protein [Prolixibacteraceae bacterium]